jgi:SH3 domain
MVEYVYARHDFVPEHDDEVPFHAGDRIEVLEKDEQYADGWWSVRSPSCSLTLSNPLPSLVSR